MPTFAIARLSMCGALRAPFIALPGE